MSQPSETSMLLTLITGIGIGSIIGAAISALFSWRVAILNLRQTSVNALRDDLATFLKEIEVMYYKIGTQLSSNNTDPFPEREKQRQEARMAVLFVHRRILLRLNRTDPLHRELAGKLYAFDKIRTKVPDQEAISDLVDVAAKLLKREEENAARWFLARPIHATVRLMGR
jgi:hypothetical protein